MVVYSILPHIHMIATQVLWNLNRTPFFAYHSYLCILCICHHWYLLGIFLFFSQFLYCSFSFSLFSHVVSTCGVIKYICGIVVPLVQQNSAFKSCLREFTYIETLVAILLQFWQVLYNLQSTQYCRHRIWNCLGKRVILLFP